MGGAQERYVTVDDEECKVWLVQSGKRTWRAYGPFRTRHIEARGASESAALSGWARSAEYAASE